MTPRAVLDRIAGWLAGAPPRPAGSRGAGWDWERAAERALTNAGYRVLERNFRTRMAEIDFVCEERGVLCFVEVKGRSSDRFGSAAEAVTGEKRRRILRAAEIYLKRRRAGSAKCRFDVVAIDGPRIAILRDAFPPPPLKT